MEHNNAETPIYANCNLSTSADLDMVTQLDTSSLKSIHKTSDDSIDWTEVLVSSVAHDEAHNQQMWSHYHSIGPKILACNIDAYLQLVYEVNPLDDLLRNTLSFTQYWMEKQFYQ